MEKIISFFKSEFPKSAIEVQECVDLLSQCLSGSVECIKNSFTTAIDQRDYDKMNALKELLSCVDDISTKLDEYSNMLSLDDSIEDEILSQNQSVEGEKQSPNSDTLRVDSNIPYSLFEDYTYKKPAAFEMFGVRHDVKDWKDVFVKTCELLVSKDAALFSRFVNDKYMQGRKVPYFCKNPRDLRNPKKINKTDIYVMTNMSANQIRNVIEKMLRKYGVKINEYKLYLRADYSSRHE